MAAQGSRTLKLSLLADVAEFSKNIKVANKDTESVGDQFTAFGKKAALAFAAAGAAIGAYAKVAIENAAADEKAQRNLALTIENTTTATALQIAGVEKYISTTSVAIGITDDELRPAFSRLVRSTKDVEDAQKLLNLALDVSAATGKPLEAVANALGKAYDGNLNALGRLGLGLDASILKSKDFDLVFKTLTDTFGGFADNEALSTEKAFARIKIASDEIQEQIGAALLPVVQELTTFILTDVVPVVQSFVDGLTGQDGLKDGLSQSQISAIEWGKKVRGVIDTVVKLKDELIILAGVIGTIFVVSKISAAVVGTIALINTLIKAYNLLKSSAIVAGVASAFALNPLLGVGAVALAAGVLSGANALARSSDGSAAAPSTGAIPFASGFGPAAGGTADEITTVTTAAAAAAAAAASKASNSLKSASAKKAVDDIVKNFNAGSFRQGEANSLLNILRDSFDAGSFRQGEENSLKTAITKVEDLIKIVDLSKSLANEFMGAERLDNNPFFNFNGQMVRGVIDATGISDAEANFRQQEALLFRMANPSVFGPVIGPAGNSQASNVVINVNAPSIIDEEGFTRALNNAQNNSFFRGTGGATNLVGI
jgi:hypothetical protein